MPPPKPADSTLIRLSCLDDDAQGSQIEVLWENEVDAELLGQTAGARLSSAASTRPSASRPTSMRCAGTASRQPTRSCSSPPTAPASSSLAYQLEPLRKALLLPRVNLFIADDVGLGKTIEAGLIIRELLMRQKIRNLVVS